jgi:hypothetical protein
MTTETTTDTPVYEGVTFKEDARKPDAPKKASTPSLFLVGCFCYIMLVLFPIHIGFGVAVVNMWFVVLPTIFFGWLVVIGGRK